MTSDDFLTLIRDDLGLNVTGDDLDRSFDEIPGWDSVLLLTLLTSLEGSTGRPVSLPDVLEAPHLRRVYELAVTE
ncbi:phosphopantetheine-binding protein [Nocardiopsis exhalans]|uniref:Phosphopantetheine-binding protein n=1 Tax=Nocardiopsis exhalans TaxID=163604 RepID=A0ABY5D232_9ACTN|nr:phosphopantetheine-binding protein [Nocardiopsis exhalans]USY18421.1 phosphopantetheine-binding protein [Nocardiopsis exhalans]